MSNNKAKVEPETPLTPQEAMEKVSLKLLQELIEGNKMKGKKTNKKQAANTIIEHAQEEGEKIFLDKLDKDTLRMAIEAHEGKDVTHDNKGKMKTQFSKLFKAETNKEAYFKKCSVNLLTKFLAALDMEEDSSQEEKADAVMEEILIAGWKKILSRLNKNFIADVCKELNLPQTGTKDVCITRIIGQAYPHYLDTIPTSKPAERVSNDINLIKKGITFEELYQYYSEELQKYAAKQGIKKTGTKKDLCKRILKYLSGDVESTRPLKPGEKKRKRGGSKKKSSAKKKGTTSTAAKKQKTK